MTTPVLAFDNVTRRFGAGAGGDTITAVSGVDLVVREGETVGLVGASGAGKTTIARLAAGLLAPDSGRIRLGGDDLATLDRRTRGRRLHLVFQDPYGALAPHHRVEHIVAEPLVIHGIGDRDRLVRRVLREVRLPPDRYARRLPHELSGGERQRVALARALVLRPSVVVADEPTQMLDPSIRAELVGLMAGLQARYGTAWLYITHDLALAHDFCDRLVVLDAGRVVEHGPAATVMADPRSAPARRLVDAITALHTSLPAR